MNYAKEFKDGRFVGVNLSPEDDSDVWFLDQKLKIVSHCGEDDCKIKRLVVAKEVKK